MSLTFRFRQHPARAKPRGRCIIIYIYMYVYDVYDMTRASEIDIVEIIYVYI